MTTQQIEDTEELIEAGERRAATILTMRSLLDFLEVNPIIPLPDFDPVDAYIYDVSDIADIARAMKPVKKSISRSIYILTHDFGNDVSLDVNFSRESVCERIVVGTEDVPEEVTPAHTREIVEWVCPESLLADDKE